MVYDPSIQTLLADKGKIEVGDKYQAKIEPMIGAVEPMDTEENNVEHLPGALNDDENKENGFAFITLTIHNFLFFFQRFNGGRGSGRHNKRRKS